MTKKSAIPKLAQLPANDLMGQLLAGRQAKLQTLAPGQTVEGTVVKIGNKVLVLDVGAKSEGLVVDREFENASSFINTLKPGDKVAAMVVVPETVSGQPLLSVRISAEGAGWRKLEEALKKREEVEIRVEGLTRGGLSVSMDSIYGFVPTSQLGAQLAANPQTSVGKTLSVKVSEVNKKENRVVFSEKAVSEAELIAQQEEALQNIREGERFTGKIINLVNFGAFVQIIRDGIPLEGLVHLSEISWQKVSDPTKVLQEGQELEVVVLGRETGRLALSIKRTQEDPWEKQVEKLAQDQQVRGKVVKMGEVGAFIEVAAGVEGLLRFNKIPDGVSLKEGEETDVFIEEIDRKNKKISLRAVLKAKPVGYK